MNPPVWLRRLTPKFIRNLCRPIFYKVQTKIEYSQEFYEKQYHGEWYRLPERGYAEIMSEWEAMGWKEMLYRVLDTVQCNLDPVNWLEPACHHGKTAVGLAERFPKATFYMFDFSRTAVEFCQNHNPIPGRSVIWQGDITQIEYNSQRFDNFFVAA